MRTVETYGTFEDAISGSGHEAQRLARKLRKVLEEIYPEVTEVPWPKQQVIGYGIGSKKNDGAFLLHRGSREAR